ncbi:hypothetical protein FSP39_013740 [Pinctada imbricata]|uniref:Uncharacterized protein n=1 Tax=Pinctada imbricata TaxID=66713 RepID=A0AA88XNG9_PINIB|nr:hypothetical protein FSP39_013740 [Pinctada imbricata]
MNPVRVSSGGSSRSDSPTMELARSFIEKPEEVKAPVVQENKHPVLPPIHQRPNTTDYPGNQAGGRPPVIVQHVVPPHNHPKKKVSLSSEVQVIAVDKVSPDSTKWATHAHESHSTEYN